MTGSGITIADFSVFALHTGSTLNPATLSKPLNDALKEAFAKFPLCTKWRDAMAEEFKEFISNRKPTPF